MKTVSVVSVRKERKTAADIRLRDPPTRHSHSQITTRSSPDFTRSTTELWGCPFMIRPGINTLATRIRVRQLTEPGISELRFGPSPKSKACDMEKSLSFDNMAKSGTRTSCPLALQPSLTHSSLVDSWADCFRRSALVRSCAASSLRPN